MSGECLRMTREMEEDAYGAEALRRNINTRWVGRNVLFFEEVDSTNLRARLEAEGGAVHGTLIAADMQTAGRGRRGRVWDSPACTNVYFTLILRPEFVPEKASMLTLVMACAAADGLERTLQKLGFSENFDRKRSLSGIKWPNDLVLRSKKICGILTEMQTEGGQAHYAHGEQSIAQCRAIKYVIIGCGINVGKQEFAPELSDKATSLEQELGRKIPRAMLVGNIMAAFEEAYGNFEKYGNLVKLQEKYNGLLVNLNREVCVLEPTGEYRGIARGINETGELLVELPDGVIREVYAGEVSVRGVYGYV